MRDRMHERPVRDTVASKLVSNETERFPSLTLQELPEESPRRTPVPAGLYENVDHIAVLIHCAPEILALPVDGNEDFVQEPRIAETTLTTFQTPGVLGTELSAPLPDRFI